jgi:2-amino-4-hydroxy-6-hydroxymethyldihydropteridine diphosphokinase
MIHNVYIGLGANLNQPEQTIRQALLELQKLDNVEFVTQSKLYSSAPMGPQDQPDYVNAVALVRIFLIAHDLFKLTCDIEQKHGRTRNGEHWGPRTLDLDILLFGQQMINDEHLTVPHYGMKEREFVIYPMLDISPDLVLPCGTKLQALTKSVSLNGMTAINE